MRLPLFSTLLFSLFLCTCAGRQKVETVEEDGSRLVYYVNPETQEKEGEFKQYYPDGSLMAEETYVKGKLAGVRKLYATDGKLLVEETYENGTFSGPYVSYQNDGKPSLVGTYTDGAMNGVWTAYHTNGAVRETVTFVNNQENGPFREWYANGKAKASGNYRDGEYEQGTLHLYTEDGTLEKVMNCERAACQTIWTPDSTGTAPAAPDMGLPE